MNDQRKPLAQINDSDIWLHFEEFESIMHYAAKAVVIDEDNKIVVLYSKKYWWYELPWWHMDEGETIEQALIRECQEEIWCDVEIIHKIGMIIEQRYREQYKKTSYYCICKVIGQKWLPHLLEWEVDQELETRRIGKNKLHNMFQQKTSDNKERIFCQMRDSFVINEFLA